MAEVPAEGALGDLVCAYSQPQSPVMPHGHLCPVSDFILQASQTTLLPTHAVLSQAAPAAQNAFLPPTSPSLAQWNPTYLSRPSSGAFHELPSFSVWTKCIFQSLHNCIRILILYYMAYLLGSLSVRLISSVSAILNSQQWLINTGRMNTWKNPFVKRNRGVTIWNWIRPIIRTRGFWCLLT